MSDGTPETPAEQTPKKAPARKPAAKRSAAKSAPAKAAAASAPAADAAPITEQAPIADPEPAPVAQATAASAPPTPDERTGASAPAPSSSPSILDRVRANRVGPLAAGLLVALLVGLLLSVLVPNDPGALAMLILGALLAAAVGFTVRYLSTCAGLRRQVEAFIAAALGIHVMAVTGLVGGELPLLDLVGAEGPSFNDALLAALATPPVSTGGLLAGLTAAIIVGWGERPRRDEHAQHHGH
ncbi:hypothetical protein [Demequina sp. NBRC 110056]|uniref:hypothetical protein n=1 Tax=Demequina sp. NBRC 110056 TaxID=1570345 RepID=UPI000A02BA41|nr:hypothetical protein [Demequina sp. NBRC 110056]